MTTTWTHTALTKRIHEEINAMILSGTVEATRLLTKTLRLAENHLELTGKDKDDVEAWCRLLKQVEIGLQAVGEKR